MALNMTEDDGGLKPGLRGLDTGSGSLYKTKDIPQQKVVAPTAAKPAQRTVGFPAQAAMTTGVGSIPNTGISPAISDNKEIAGTSTAGANVGKPRTAWSKGTGLLPPGEAPASDVSGANWKTGARPGMATDPYSTRGMDKTWQDELKSEPPIPAVAPGGAWSPVDSITGGIKSLKDWFGGLSEASRKGLLSTGLSMMEQGGRTHSPENAPNMLGIIGGAGQVGLKTYEEEKSREQQQQIGLRQMSHMEAQTTELGAKTEFEKKKTAFLNDPNIVIIKDALGNERFERKTAGLQLQPGESVVKPSGSEAHPGSAPKGATQSLKSFIEQGGNYDAKNPREYKAWLNNQPKSEYKDFVFSQIAAGKNLSDAEAAYKQREIAGKEAVTAAAIDKRYGYIQKMAIDNESGDRVFASAKDIHENPDRYMPMAGSPGLAKAKSITFQTQVDGMRNLLAPHGPMAEYETQIKALGQTEIAPINALKKTFNIQTSDPTQAAEEMLRNMIGEEGSRILGAGKGGFEVMRYAKEMFNDKQSVSAQLNAIKEFKKGVQSWMEIRASGTPMQSEIKKELEDWGYSILNPKQMGGVWTSRENGREFSGSKPATGLKLEGVAGAGGKTIVQTGMHNGKKVVKYSDGSIEYAR